MNNMIIINGLFEQDLISFIPEIFLSCFIMFLLTFGLLINSNKGLNFPYMLKICSFLAIYILFFVLLLYYNNITFDYNIFLNQYISTRLILFFKLLLISIAIIVILLSFDYYRFEQIYTFEYIIIYLLALLGMLLMLSSNDFIFFYLSIELQSLALYLLAAYKRYSNFSTEAGLKYFVLGAFSSGLLLFGISLIYGFTGLTNFTELSYFLIDAEIMDEMSRLIIVGFLFFLVGLLFKLAAAPFHMWAPDVYQGAPTIVTLFFSTLPKLAVLGFLIRILDLIFIDFGFFTDQVLIFSALFSLIIGVFGAIYQVRIKRLLAYSAISHIGFMLLALVGQTREGLFAVLFYLVAYLMIVLSIFAIILSLRNRISGYLIRDIKDLSTLSHVNLPLAFIFSIILFSIGGIPPLIGFFSKFYVFLNIIELELYLIALIAIISSVLGIIYYIRLIKIMFFTNIINDTKIFYASISKVQSFIIILTLFINLFFFLYPAPLIFLVTENLMYLNF